MYHFAYLQDDVDGPGMKTTPPSFQRVQDTDCRLNASGQNKPSMENIAASAYPRQRCDREEPGPGTRQSKIASLINIHMNQIDKQNTQVSRKSQLYDQAPRVQQVVHNIQQDSVLIPDMNEAPAYQAKKRSVLPNEVMENMVDTWLYVNSAVVIADAIHQSIGKFCVSKIGTIVFIHGKQDSFGRTHFSLRKVENGETKTIIPESSEMINDITLIETDGADCPEALVVVYGEMLTVVGLYNERAERRILKLDNPNSFICAHGRNSVVVVTRVIGAHENDTHLLIQTLQITGSKTKLRTCVPTKFDVAGLNDICVRRDLLFVCCRKNNYVAAIGITDGDFHWKVKVKSPFGICRVKNHLFVTSYAEHRVVRINAQTGMVNDDLPVESFVQAPTSVYFSDGHLHMAHVDANNLRQINRKDWCISQYKVI